MNVHCPNCQAINSVPSTMPAGQTMRCGSCQQTFAVPTPPQAATPAQQQAGARLAQSLGPSIAAATAPPPAPIPAFATAGSSSASPVTFGSNAPALAASAAPALPPPPRQPASTASGSASASVLPAIREFAESLKVFVGEIGSAAAPAGRALAPLQEFGQAAALLVRRTIAPLLEIGSKLAGLTGAILEPIMAPLRKALAPLGEYFAGVMSNVRASLGRAMEPVADLFAGLRTRLAPLTSYLGEVGVAAVKAGGAIGSYAAGVGGAFAGVGAAAAGLVTGMAQAVLPFVQAFNPTRIGLFNEALGSVQATIGRALEPVLEGVTDVMREFASMLAPLMQQLRPAIAQLTQSMLSAIRPIMDAGIAMAQALLPIVQPALAVFEAAMIGFRGLVTVIGAVATSLTQFVGGLAGGEGVKSWTEALVESVKKVTSSMILLSAAIGQFFGVTSIRDNLIKALTPGKGMAERGVADLRAPGGANISSLQSYSQEVVRLAFSAVASGGPEKKTQEDYLKETVEELKRLQDGTKTAEQVMKEQADKVIAAINAGFASVTEKVYGEGRRLVGQGAIAIGGGRASGIGAGWGAQLGSWLRGSTSG